MVNVEELNRIIDGLKEDADKIHEIGQLCVKITEVGNDVERQQSSAEKNGEKLASIAKTMSSMQEQYNNALNKLSAATSVLETSATELRTEMKRFENDNNDRLETFRTKTAEQLSANEAAIEKRLADNIYAEKEELRTISTSLVTPISELKRELNTVKVISIIGAICALAAVILSFVH